MDISLADMAQMGSEEHISGCEGLYTYVMLIFVMKSDKQKQLKHTVEFYSRMLFLKVVMALKIVPKENISKLF